MREKIDKQLPPTEYDVLMQARRRTVAKAVEALKAIADAKALAPARRASGTPGPRENIGRASDAIYELMQLHFAVGNRLASVQSDYRSFATRALERGYETFARTTDSKCEELRLVGAGEMTEVVRVVHQLGEERSMARITWGPLCGPRPMPPIADALRVEVRNAEILRNEVGICEFVVAFGRPEVIVMLTIDLDRIPALEHRTELVVEMARQRRKIRICAKRTEEQAP